MSKKSKKRLDDKVRERFAKAYHERTIEKLVRNPESGQHLLSAYIVYDGLFGQDKNIDLAIELFSKVDKSKVFNYLEAQYMLVNIFTQKVLELADAAEKKGEANILSKLKVAKSKLNEALGNIKSTCEALLAKDPNNAEAKFYSEDIEDRLFLLKEMGSKHDIYIKREKIIDEQGKPLVKPSPAKVKGTMFTQKVKVEKEGANEVQTENEDKQLHEPQANNNMSAKPK